LSLARIVRAVKTINRRRVSDSFKFFVSLIFSHKTKHGYLQEIPKCMSRHTGGNAPKGVYKPFR
jgi:hypothetical protein